MSVSPPHPFLSTAASCLKWLNSTPASPTPIYYSEGAWPIWLEGSIYRHVSRCLPRAADTHPRFLRHWPPSSLCGDPLSAPLSFQTVCPRLCPLHKRLGNSGGLGGEKDFGALVGGREYKRCEETACCALRPVVRRQTLYFLVVFCTAAKWKRRNEAKTGLCPTRRWGFASSLPRSLRWRREEPCTPQQLSHRIRSVF